MDKRKRQKQSMALKKEGQKLRVKLLVGEEGNEWFRQRCESREWWIFLANNIEAIETLIKIEETFYPPGSEADKDFEAYLCVSLSKGPVCMVMAKKERLPRLALQEFMPVDISDGKDIFCMGDIDHLIPVIEFLAGLNEGKGEDRWIEE